MRLKTVDTFTLHEVTLINSARAQAIASRRTEPAQQIHAEFDAELARVFVWQDYLRAQIGNEFCGGLPMQQVEIPDHVCMPRLRREWDELLGEQFGEVEDPQMVAALKVFFSGLMFRAMTSGALGMTVGRNQLVALLKNRCPLVPDPADSGVGTETGTTTTTMVTTGAKPKPTPKPKLRRS